MDIILILFTITIPSGYAENAEMHFNFVEKLDEGRENRNDNNIYYDDNMGSKHHSMENNHGRYNHKIGRNHGNHNQMDSAMNEHGTHASIIGSLNNPYRNNADVSSFHKYSFSPGIAYMHGASANRIAGDSGNSFNPYRHGASRINGYVSKNGNNNIGYKNGRGNDGGDNNGNENIGTLNGNANYGSDTGNQNRGHFNGNGNDGIGNSNYNRGHKNGNSNKGNLNASANFGNNNGNFNKGHLNGNSNKGNNNGNGNIGMNNGNNNGRSSAAKRKAIRALWKLWFKTGCHLGCQSDTSRKLLQKKWP